MTAGRVVVDLVAPQSPSYRERGIARHGLDFANALLDRHPELIDRILLHPELPPAGGLEGLIASGKAATDLVGVEPGGVFHVTSAFEPEIPARSLWPRSVSALRMRLVVTIYDLIPDIFPEMYLMDPGLRRRWRSCRELARGADRVLALSDSGADDVVRLLGVPPERVSIIGAGCDPRFRPATTRAEARTVAQEGVAGLGEHFVVCNGAIDPRKNLDRLIQAYAGLPSGIRDRWQLVLVCRADPLQRNHYLAMAERLGLSGRILLPGYVPDSVLVALYQSADLSVFPSLYEGYGLPVVEAQACGAPVVASDNSSLRELVEPEARFDATDVGAIGTAMAAALTDDDLRSRLLAAARRPPPTWAEVADRTAAVYQDLIERDRGDHLVPGWRVRPLLAVVSPPAPSDATGAQGGGEVPLTAGFGQALTRALEAAGAEVDRFVDGPDAPTKPAGTSRDPEVGSSAPRGSAATRGDGARTDPPLLACHLPRMDRWRGGYDLVVCCIGDDPQFLGALRLLRGPSAADLPITVIAHDVALPRLYQAAADAGQLDGDLAAVVRHMYPGLPLRIAEDGQLDEVAIRRHGLVMAREVIADSRRYLVATEADSHRARVDARPEHAGRVELISTSTRGRGSVDDFFRELADELLARLSSSIEPLRPADRDAEVSTSRRP